MIHKNLSRKPQSAIKRTRYRWNENIYKNFTCWSTRDISTGEKNIRWMSLVLATLLQASWFNLENSFFLCGIYSLLSLFLLIWIFQLFFPSELFFLQKMLEINLTISINTFVIFQFFSYIPFLPHIRVSSLSLRLRCRHQEWSFLFFNVLFLLRRCLLADRLLSHPLKCRNPGFVIFPLGIFRTLTQL